MRRYVILVVTLTAALLGSLVTVPSASAAQAVTIKKIPNKKVAYGKKATIKPAVRAARTTRVVSKRLTVKRGKKVVARNRNSVRLKPGKYKVTTSVKYRTKRTKVVTQRVRKNVLTVPAYQNTPVTCVVSNARTETLPALADLSCTGTSFDGTHAFFDVMLGDDGQVAAWNSAWSYVFGPVSSLSEGASLALTMTPSSDLFQVRIVTVRKVVTTWSGVKSKKRTQSLTIKQRPRPNRTEPDAWGECPDWAPIKGNGDSMIYHVPGGRYYEATIAEECFRTEKAARDAGYRASRGG